MVQAASSLRGWRKVRQAISLAAGMVGEGAGARLGLHGLEAGFDGTKDGREVFEREGGVHFFLTRM